MVNSISGVPATQWAANSLVRQQIAVPLPADFAPDSYGVLVGVYVPDNAAAPLVPTGQENPRVAICTLVKGP
jgi:hypothetical protein